MRLFEVNGDPTPIATSGPSAYKRAKNDAIRFAMCNLVQLSKRKREVNDNGVIPGKRVRMSGLQG